MLSLNYYWKENSKKICSGDFYASRFFLLNFGTWITSLSSLCCLCRTSRNYAWRCGHSTLYLGHCRSLHRICLQLKVEIILSTWGTFKIIINKKLRCLVGFQSQSSRKSRILLLSTVHHNVLVKSYLMCSHYLFFSVFTLASLFLTRLHVCVSAWPWQISWFWCKLVF